VSFSEPKKKHPFEFGFFTRLVQYVFDLVHILFSSQKLDTFFDSKNAYQEKMDHLYIEPWKIKLPSEFLFRPSLNFANRA
jgi:hypothetical protein